MASLSTLPNTATERQPGVHCWPVDQISFLGEKGLWSPSQLLPHIGLNKVQLVSDSYLTNSFSSETVNHVKSDTPWLVAKLLAWIGASCWLLTGITINGWAAWLTSGRLLEVQTSIAPSPAPAAHGRLAPGRLARNSYKNTTSCHFPRLQVYDESRCRISPKYKRVEDKGSQSPPQRMNFLNHRFGSLPTYLPVYSALPTNLSLIMHTCTLIISSLSVLLRGHRSKHI